MAERIIWGIHMQREHGTVPIEKGYVAIGWRQMGDLSKISPTREAFKAAYETAYPDAGPGTVRTSAGVPFRFSVEMKVGDLVIFPSKADRMVNIGLVEGGYEYHPDAPRECPHWRSIKWLKHIPRSDFSQAARHEIGSALTLFRVASNAEEFLAALQGDNFEVSDNDEVTAELVSEQAEESTVDFIVKRLKTSQNPYQFEHFVAHLLKCMGYFSRVTQASGDGGVDIIAHRDELGFEPPIIKVQCKQTLSTIGRPDVQKLFGAIEREEKGLFVTLGSFSPDARTFEQTKHNLRLIDVSTLIELIYEHYHKFDPKYQMLLPLKRSYIPGPLATSSNYEN